MRHKYFDLLTVLAFAIVKVIWHGLLGAVKNISGADIASDKGWVGCKSWP